jgi:hypothetical protein
MFLRVALMIKAFNHVDLVDVVVHRPQGEDLYTAQISRSEKNHDLSSAGARVLERAASLVRRRWARAAYLIAGEAQR